MTCVKVSYPQRDGSGLINGKTKPMMSFYVYDCTASMCFKLIVPQRYFSLNSLKE